jgi:hypothetical protein
MAPIMKQCRIFGLVSSWSAWWKNGTSVSTIAPNSDELYWRLDEGRNLKITDLGVQTKNLIVIHEMPLCDGCVGVLYAIRAASLGSSFSGTLLLPVILVSKTFQQPKSPQIILCIVWRSFIESIIRRELWPYIIPDTNLCHWFLLAYHIIE